MRCHGLKSPALDEPQRYIDFPNQLALSLTDILIYLYQTILLRLSSNLNQLLHHTCTSRDSVLTRIHVIVHSLICYTIDSRERIRDWKPQFFTRSVRTPPYSGFYKTQTHKLFLCVSQQWRPLKVWKFLDVLSSPVSFRFKYYVFVCIL